MYPHMYVIGLSIKGIIENSNPSLEAGTRGATVSYSTWMLCIYKEISVTTVTQ